ncbi:Glycosyl phosphatidyl inositol protein transamidase complex subunit [Mortierella sp. GBA30]|nr:Glycosyl phosphatidyl inositol protein transamidase complex subunit [Mortierella sp. GBA30]
MGLMSRLSKTQRRHIFGRFVLGWMPILSYVMVAVSFLWLLALPHQGYSKGTYISENALLPGSANVRFDYSDSLAAEAYRDVIDRISTLSSYERAQALEYEFSQIGLKSATQNYTLNTSTDSKHGVNTYAVFYAPRSDGTEALVLSASWTSRDKTGCSHFSKDIIFVVSDGEADGLQAWLKAYHGNEENTQARTEETLRVRSGAIQAALNLDFAGTGDYNAMGIFFEGVNGQLPNLDMINTVASIAEGFAPVELTLHDELIPYTPNMTKDYINSLKRMLYMMKYQAVGSPTGNHGLYLKYKIDAITLYGFDKPGWHSHRYSLYRLGTGVQRYTSIGLYMPPVIILGVSFIFKALSLWGLSSDLPLEMEATAQGEKVAVGLPYSRRSRRYKVASTVIAMSFVSGMASFYLLTNQFGVPGETPLLKLTASVGVCIMLVLSAVSSAHVRNSILKSTSTNNNTSADLLPAADWVILKTFVLSLSALIVTTLSALNFSLAVSIGLIIVFPYMAFRPSRFVIFSAFQAIALVAISPPGLLLAASWWYSKDVNMVLAWVLEGYEVLGTWLLPTICCVYWPVNLAATVMVLLPVS